MIKFYNTKTREKEKFKPLENTVRIYTCGPTVYDYAHIGNLRTYIFEDVLKRVLNYNGHDVKHIMNITDVGHLASDDDSGEDKVEQKAREEGKSAKEIAKFYTKQFKKDLENLNINPPTNWVKATETITEQIELIKVLEEKGFTYQIEDGIYFDTSQLDDYGKMSNLEEREGGKRVDMKGKRNNTDFALWKFSKPDENRQMEWESPWGTGFPGWHTECVVMGKNQLGIPFDIHCGGVDHIEIHHPNEIAQAKAAFNKNPAKFWMHGEFLTVKDEKMSKSKGNFYTLADIEDNFSPLAFRYLCLNSHYRSKMNFSTKALEGAERSLDKLQEKFTELKKDKEGTIDKNYKEEFLAAINNDLNTPQALQITWDLLKDQSISDGSKRATLLDFEDVLGLNFTKKKSARLTPNGEVSFAGEIPNKIIQLTKKRKKFREQEEYDKADEIRKKINNQGYKIKDVSEGYKIIEK